MDDSISDVVVNNVEQTSMEDSIRATLIEIQAREPEVEEVLKEPIEKEVEEKAPLESTDIKEEIKENIQNPAPTEQVQAIGSDGLPANWTPEVKKEFQNREEAYKKTVDQYKQAANFGAEVHKALTPYAATLNQLQQQGISPAIAIDKLLSADNVLRHGTQAQKRDSIAKLIHSYNVDMSDGLPQIDPQSHAYQQEIYRRDQELARSREDINYLKQQQAQREQQEINAIIETTKKGREYFDMVRPFMKSALESGAAKDLPEAYEQAIWAHPEVRKKMLEKQQLEVKKQQTEIAKQAKKSAAGNLPVRGTYPAAAPTQNMHDFIKDEYHRLMGQI